jgi:hypothetical protein
MKHRIERLAQIETEARRLARSGAFRDFSAIRHALIEGGYPDAWQIFTNPWTQSEIDRLCDLARAAGSDEAASGASRETKQERRST